MPPHLINYFQDGFELSGCVSVLGILSRLSWDETLCFAKSFLYDKYREDTIDFIRNACIQQLNVKLGGEAESHLRRFLLRLPPANVGPAPMVRIRARNRPNRDIPNSDEDTSAGKIDFSINVQPFNANGWGWLDSEPITLEFDRLVGSRLMALCLPFFIRYVARRYTGIYKLEIQNEYGEDAFVGISLQDILKPFAGHWKVSLKEISVHNFDLSLDDDIIDFETYTESLEVVWISFFTAASKNNMHSTLFKLMLHSRCLKEADGFGHCGVLSPLAVQCFCDLMLKTTKFCDRSRYEPRAWNNYHHTIAPWFPLYIHVSAVNTDAMQKTLSAGCIHNDSGMALPRHWSSSNAEQTLAVVYHFSVLARFRVLLADHENGRHLIPHFLNRLQLNRVGGSSAAADRRRLLFALLRESPIKNSDKNEIDVSNNQK
jgi:hypothetical protein